MTMPDKPTLPQGVSGFEVVGKVNDGVFHLAFKAQYHGHTLGHIDHFLLKAGQSIITEYQYNESLKKIIQYIQSHV